jgi:hypothetical protein
MKGLIVKDPFASLILNGVKTWEIRGRNTNIRGTIAIIKSGTRMIFGTVKLVESEPLTRALFDTSYGEHRIPFSYKLPYNSPHFWVLQEPDLWDEPVLYDHPQGAVIWVNLGDGYHAK